MSYTTSRRMSGMGGEVFPSTTPYIEYQGFERGHCAQGPSWYKGFEQQRKCPKGGGEGLPGASQPPWKVSASRNNHDAWSARVTVARVAVRAQLTLLDAASFSQARRFRQKAPVKIPPHEASGNPWHVLSVKSPPNYEEQWKRSDSPIPSRFRHLGCTLTGCLGSNRRHLQGMTGRRSTQSGGLLERCASFAASTSH